MRPFGSISRAEAYGGRGSTQIALRRFREAAADAEESLRHGVPEPRMLYNAARTLAQAAEAASGEVGQRGGSDVATARRLQDRALQLLGQAVERTAPDRAALSRAMSSRPIRPWRCSGGSQATLDPPRNTDPLVPDASGRDPAMGLANELCLETLRPAVDSRALEMVPKEPELIKQDRHR